MKTATKTQSVSSTKMAVATLALFVAGGAALAAGGMNVKKTALCHIPPDNPTKRIDISVGKTALAEHIEHGDYAGPCNRLTNLQHKIYTEVIFTGDDGR